MVRPSDGKLGRLAREAPGEPQPEPVHGGLRPGSAAKAEHFGAVKFETAVVGGTVERDDCAMRLQQRNEGQEELTVQPVAIEIVGQHVRGCNQCHAAREQLLEQPPEQHGIGDV